MCTCTHKQESEARVSQARGCNRNPGFTSRLCQSPVMVPRRHLAESWFQQLWNRNDRFFSYLQERRASSPGCRLGSRQGHPPWTRNFLKLRCVCILSPPRPAWITASILPGLVPIPLLLHHFNCWLWNMLLLPRFPFLLNFILPSSTSFARKLPRNSQP